MHPMSNIYLDNGVAMGQIMAILFRDMKDWHMAKEFYVEHFAPLGVWERVEKLKEYLSF